MVWYWSGFLLYGVASRFSLDFHFRVFDCVVRFEEFVEFSLDFVRLVGVLVQ